MADDVSLSVARPARIDLELFASWARSVERSGKRVLILYQNPTAVSPIKVRLVLAEKKLPWEARDLDLRAGDQHEPDYLKLNANGVVPTLLHGDRVIVESTVIMLYLDEEFPGEPLQPPDAWARARMRLWLKHVDEILHPANVTLIYALRHRQAIAGLPKAERAAYYARIPDPAVRRRQKQAIELGVEAPDIVLALAGFHRIFARMEEGLVLDRWLAGSRWSLADAAMTPYADRAESFGFFTVWGPSLPRVMEWCGRVRARPSYQTEVVPYLPRKTLPDFKDSTLLGKLEAMMAAS